MLRGGGTGGVRRISKKEYTDARLTRPEKKKTALGGLFLNNLFLQVFLLAGGELIFFIKYNIVQYIITFKSFIYLSF
jgi:hypothetical protein